MASYARQSDVLKITDEQALEGYWYLVKNRPTIADKHEDYKQVRLEARNTAEQLARIERAFGTRRLRDWLSEMEGRAIAKLGQEEEAA